VLIAKDFIFIHVPRTGGTWLRELLKKDAPRSWLLRERCPLHRPVCAELDELDRVGEARVYWFVRNPWEWYVSQWKYWSGHYHARTGGYVGPRRDWTYNERYWARLVERLPSFQAALPLMLEERSLSFALESQCTAVPGMRVGQPLRFEQLRAGARQILESSGAGLSEGLAAAIAEEPAVNISKHGHYSEYYTGTGVEAVYRRDAGIITEFGYEFKGEQG